MIELSKITVREIKNAYNEKDKELTKTLADKKETNTIIQDQNKIINNLTDKVNTLEQ